MADATKIKIAIPKELADELASDGVAMVQRQSRSAAWQLVLTATSTAAVVVTLLQAPETLNNFARGCLKIIRKKPQGVDQIIHAVGPGGELRLTVTSETDFQEVKQFLEKVLFPREEKE